MPGGVIARFGPASAPIADAGIYDPRDHVDDVVIPLLRYWRVFDIGGLDLGAERRLYELIGFLERLKAAATRFTEKRAARATQRVYREQAG